MRIEDTRGAKIANLDDWAQLYGSPRSSHQWKEGRSAHSAAEFMINRNGAERLRARVADALGESVELERLVPEYETRFDDYGQGRMHDLAVFGNTSSGRSLFVGVEAKVDESFGASVRDAYLAAKTKEIAGKSTNAPKRIENLLQQHFKVPDLAMFDVRYQLLYATAGTIAADADVSVLYVAVFKTELYNETTGAENYRDYLDFMEKVGASRLPLSSNEAQGHRLTLNGKELICLHEYFEL